MERFDWNAAREEPTAHFHQRLCDTLAALPACDTLPGTDACPGAPAHAPRRQFRRVAPLARAAALLLCGTAFAARLVFGYVVNSSTKDAVNTLPAAQALAEKADFDFLLPQAFANGFTFSRALPGKGQTTDEAGAPLAGYQSLNVTYRRGKEKMLFALAPQAAFDPSGSQSSTVYHGTTLYTATVVSAVVPKGYQPTAEEQARVERGTLIFACNGGTTRTESTQTFVYWQQENVACTLFANSTECALTADELKAMAEKMVDGG